MNIRKIAYWFLPPIIFRLYNFCHFRLFGQTELNNGRHESLDVIEELRKKKFSYFFDERVIEEFCEAVSKENKLNQPISTKDEKNQKNLDELIENGLCVVRGLFDRKEVEVEHNLLVLKLKKLQERSAVLGKIHGKDSGLNISESHYGIPVNFELMSNIIRIWDIDLLQNNLSSFKESPVIQDICSSYFGGNMNPSSLYVEYKYDKFSYDPNLHLHTDTPFRQLKVFILLSDVNETNAPLIYFKKTQKFDDWRLMKDLLDFSSFNKKYNASFGFNRLEMAQMASRFPNITDRETLVTGKAGDVIIAETRGVHGGTLLHEGHRLQLGLVYAGLGSPDMNHITNRIKSLSSNSKQTHLSRN